MDTIIKTKSKRTAKTALAKPIVQKKKSKKEQNLLELVRELQVIAKKHNMQPFNRKDFYEK